MCDPTHDQRLEALNAANEIRRTRAALKRTWAQETRDAVAEQIATLIAAPPDWARTWRVSQLLKNLHQWGEVAVTKRLRQLYIQPETPLQELTPGQRLGLVELIAPSLLASEPQP